MTYLEILLMPKDLYLYQMKLEQLFRRPLTDLPASRNSYPLHTANCSPLTAFRQLPSAIRLLVFTFLQTIDNRNRRRIPCEHFSLLAERLFQPLSSRTSFSLLIPGSLMSLASDQPANPSSSAFADSAPADKPENQLTPTTPLPPPSSAPANANDKPKGILLGFAAILGALGNVMAFFDKLPLNGKSNIIVIVILCLLIVVFAILTLKKENSRIITALSVTTLVVGLIGLLYFIPIFLVLQFTSSPPIRGYPVSETPERRHEASIPFTKAQGNLGIVELSHELAFNEDADFAQVEISVPDEYQQGVTRLSVEPERPNAVKLSTMPRQGPAVDGFYIEPVATSTKVTLSLYLTLEDKTAVPPQLNVFYKYWRKDSFWRLMEWIHGRYA
jgi:hypothetical protein